MNKNYEVHMHYECIIDVVAKDEEEALELSYKIFKEEIIDKNDFVLDDFIATVEEVDGVRFIDFEDLVN